MIVLGLDTCLSACSVAVIDGAQVLAAHSEPMTRGHQERLAPLAAEVMARAGLGFGRLERIGVTLGPGSFTGLRVGLAFGKGLALALGVPCVGVGTLEALVASATEGAGLRTAMIDAKRGQVWVQAFRDDRAITGPTAMLVEEAVLTLGQLAPKPVLVGSGGPLLIAAGLAVRLIPLDAPDPVAVARLAAAVAHPEPPRPLYLRAPDARLPS